MPAWGVPDGKAYALHKVTGFWHTDQRILDTPAVS
jgi:hypothetical protein